MTPVSEVSKHRERVACYCAGCGLDLGSGGDPVTPEAISLDLPPFEAEAYTTTYFGGPIHLRGDARDLHWFRDGVLDYVFSSHVLEDFHDWREVLAEWMRVIRPGGYLVLLVPETVRWALAVDAGQVMNHNHCLEFREGEIAEYLRSLDWEIVEDGWAAPGMMTPHGTPDFSLLTVARRPQ